MDDYATRPVRERRDVVDATEAESLHDVGETGAAAREATTTTTLIVSVCAGSWAPQHTAAAGRPVGGVAAWAVWDAPSHAYTRPAAAAACFNSLRPAPQRVMLRYLVRFHPGFDFALGGTLPGVRARDAMRVRFGWRAGGRVHVLSELTASPAGGYAAPAPATASRDVYGYFLGRWSTRRVAGLPWRRRAR